MLSRGKNKFIWMWVVALSLASCASEIPQTDLKKLTGYWEIEKVTMPNGEEKKYTVNTVLDYINVEGLEGYRKKVYPNLDGTFRTTDDAETFALKKTDDGWQMHYKNEGNAWTEQLIKLSDDHFEVKNTENITYTYKRWQEMELGVSR